jgi:hypothetical protein
MFKLPRISAFALPRFDPGQANRPCRIPNTLYGMCLQFQDEAFIAIPCGIAQIFKSPFGDPIPVVCI